MTINDKVTFNDKRTGPVECWITEVHVDENGNETHADLRSIERGYNIMHVPVRFIKKTEE